MPKAFTYTKWNSTYNEAIRILENSYTDSESRKIKILWLPKFKEIMFYDIMAKHIDLLAKEQDYKAMYEKCLNTLSYLSNKNALDDYKDSPTIEDMEKAMLAREQSCLLQIKQVQQTRKELMQEYDETIDLWHKYETLYKRALLCYTSSYYHPLSELCALKLTHQDDMKLDSPEQIEMCYTLAKRERKFLFHAKKNVSTTNYLTKKMIDVISKNHNFLNFAQDKANKDNSRSL